MFLSLYTIIIIIISFCIFMIECLYFEISHHHQEESTWEGFLIPSVAYRTLIPNIVCTIDLVLIAGSFVSG